MTTNKKTFAKVMTDPGTLVYPKLNAPDTKFKAEGEYQGKVRLDAEASAKLIKQFEAELKKYWPIAQAELEQKVSDAKTGPEKAKAKKALAEMKEADKPFKPAYDDDGNETDEFEFNFKMPASFKSSKDGKVVTMKPDIFDAKGALLKNPPEIWGGTTACVAGELRPFSMPIGVGLSLRLKAVQIIELRSSGGGDRSAGSYGFGAREDGYEGDSEATSGGFEDRSGGSDTGSDGPNHEDF
ncbi:hypothetical protein [Rhizobacter sp. Root1221]|uniref:hypothetical protein n=1 Tax=Rhizobacter sp. Root1221 TaxID=1736433 RepID=UPI0006FC93A6|nr:hypothetical protein [Rhizobacter sp. Root1221]KQW02236.1 hypothetical protein ASC87_13480 [Rhizobacter sp. Root1221]